MTQSSVSIPVAAAPARRRVRRPWLRPHRIAIFVFLVMAALFFSIPLYVIVVTSFKSMNEIRLGEIFSLPHEWTLDAWRYAWNEACSGMQCGGVSVGFINSMWILVPSLILTISLPW